MARMNRSELHLGRAALLLAVIVVGLLFWDSPVLLPLKLLSVMAHETGHALATLVAGGSVDTITVRPNESGECLSQVPASLFAKVLVYAGGYVGNALFSAVLLLLTFRFDARRLVLYAGCAWLGVVGVLYARDAFTLAFCLVMALAFAACAKWLPDGPVGLLNLFLAGFMALYALVDLKSDLWDHAVRARSDAQFLADATIVPAVVWAALWTLVAGAVLVLGAWVAVHDRVAVRRQARASPQA